MIWTELVEGTEEKTYEISYRVSSTSKIKVVTGTEWRSDDIWWTTTTKRSSVREE